MRFAATSGEGEWNAEDPVAFLLLTPIDVFMGIRFACHHCDKSLHIKADLAGRRGVCPSCRGRFRIPAQDARQSSPVEVRDQRPDASDESSTAVLNEASDAESTREGASSGSLHLMDHDATAKWYVRPPAGGQYGPADRGTLDQWIEEGRVAPQALVWRDGWPQWRAAAEALPDRMAQLERAAPPPVGPDSPPPTDAVSVGPSGDEIAVRGEASLGANRRVKNGRRVAVLIGLTVLLVCLIGVLVWLVRR